MLIHPWDAAISDTEWRDWLAGHDFGQLAVSDPGNRASETLRRSTTPRPRCGPGPRACWAWRQQLSC